MRALRERHRRPRSGSTPHDRRLAPRLAPPIAFTSRRALGQEGDVHTTSADSLQAPRPHPPPSSSPSKKRVVFIPADNTSRLPPPPPHRRSIRDLQIPIGCTQPSRAPSSPRFPPYEAFGRRPRRAPRACKGPASKTLQPGPASETLQPKRQLALICVAEFGVFFNHRLCVNMARVAVARAEVCC